MQLQVTILLAPVLPLVQLHPRPDIGQNASCTAGNPIVDPQASLFDRMQHKHYTWGAHVIMWGRG